jgi:hypothetical protein
LPLNEEPNVHRGDDEELRMLFTSAATVISAAVEFYMVLRRYQKARQAHANPGKLQRVG